jgi:hypothetical protein
LASAYYEHLPWGVRRFLNPLVEPVYDALRRGATLLSDLYPSLTLIEDNGGRKILLAGRGKTSLFFRNQILGGALRESTSGKLPFWRIPSLDMPEDQSLVVEADRTFSKFMRRRSFVAIPEWVLFTMDISRPFPEIITNWKKIEGENLRKIRKNNYSCEMTDDPRRVEHFHRTMFLPYIIPRFGKTAQIASVAYMKNLIRKGTLLIVKKGEEKVSGLLISTTGKNPLLAFMGVKDGREDLVRDGVISALYYFSILWAKEAGYKTMDFGHARPLLNDGLLRYKKRWGMKVMNSPRKPGTIYIAPGRLGPSIKEFLLDNPLICQEEGRLMGCLFMPAGDPPSVREIEELERKHDISGLEGFRTILLRTGPRTGTWRRGLMREKNRLSWKYDLHPQ